MAKKKHRTTPATNRGYDQAVHGSAALHIPAGRLPADEDELPPDEEQTDEPAQPGVERAGQPKVDDLSERGILHDENYDRDSYDFGKPPVDPDADAPNLVPPAEDPIEESVESEHTVVIATGADAIEDLPEDEPRQRPQQRRAPPRRQPGKRASTKAKAKTKTKAKKKSAASARKKSARGTARKVTSKSKRRAKR